METIITPNCVSNNTSIVTRSTVFNSQTSLLVSTSSLPFHHSKQQLRSLRIESANNPRRRNLGPIHASSESETITADKSVSDRWILEPVGDGDSRHIGFKVEMPNAFEIDSSEVTVGRLPDKADMVIPVATVSGIHARIKNKGEELLVMDLDSTNGTFINDKRLRPGVVAVVSPGSFITFGDTHLAMFRALKLQKMETPSKAEPSEDQSDDSPTVSTETS